MEKGNKRERDHRLSLLLKIRSVVKKKKPRFIRMNSWYLTRLPDSWRNPSRSLDNKIRLQKKGYPAKVKIGYRGPRLVRGFHPSGKREVLVSNIKDLENLDPELHVVRISSSVGMRKRREIIKKAAELGLKILNVK
ncbi:MAG TPA: 50S ribosomal protein L32e [Thermofilum sp.]|nr:50S ribosomal protein L32e [Thermofilum sp.]